MSVVLQVDPCSASSTTRLSCAGGFSHPTRYSVGGTVSTAFPEPSSNFNTAILAVTVLFFNSGCSEGLFCTDIPQDFGSSATR